MDWGLAMSDEVQSAIDAAIGRLIRQGATGDLEDDDLRQEALIWVASNPASARKALAEGYLPNRVHSRLLNHLRPVRVRQARTISLDRLAVQE